MWIQLTKPSDVKFLLNADYIIQVTEVAAGGVQLTAINETVEPNGERKARTYRAKESLAAVAKLLERAPASRKIF